MVSIDSAEHGDGRCDDERCRKRYRKKFPGGIFRFEESLHVASGRSFDVAARETLLERLFDRTAVWVGERYCEKVRGVMICLIIGTKI